MTTQKRKNPIQVFAEDVTDEDMESITKIAQNAFQLPFSDFQESRVFTKIADFIRQKLNKQFGEYADHRSLCSYFDKKFS